MKSLQVIRKFWSDTEFLPVFIGAFILGFAAWQNMFPLVYADSGTYLVTGLDGRVPVDRPLLYGLFLRHTSMRASLWFALTAQLLLVASPLFAFVKHFFRHSRYRLIYYGITLVLCFFTAISIKTSTLIPDVFTPLPFLLIYLLTRKESAGILRWWFSILLVFSIACHTSHLLILLIALVFLFLWKWYYSGFASVSKEIFRHKYLAALILVAWLTSPMIHYAYGGKFISSPGTDIFLMGRMADNGMLRKYLLENCEDGRYEMCQHIDEIPPDFLWDSKSPLYSSGGWSAPHPEYGQIVRDMVSQPRYWLPLGYKSFYAGLSQFFQFNITVRAENAAMGVDSPPYYPMRDVFKNEINQYLGSNQNTGRLDYSDLDQRQNIFLLLLSAIFFFLFITKKDFIGSFTSLLAFTIFYLASNAFVCGVLSIPNPRYQTRVFWLLPFVVCMILIAYFTQEKSGKKTAL